VLSVSLVGWPSQNIVNDLSGRGICISAGSACHQGKPSHVIATLKLPKKVSGGVIRLSFGPETTKEEIDACVAALREHHDTRMPMLTSGQIDVICANITGNLTRAQTIDFSIPYLRCGIKMLTQAGSPYTELADLNTPEAKIAVGRGTTNEALALQYAPEAELIYADAFTEQKLLLEQGRVDACMEDSSLVDYAAGTSEGALVAQDKLYTSDPICLGARKGDIEWVRFLDMFVSWQVSSGWQRDTYYKWWGTEPTAELVAPW
jgi:polar amino acid transport system substrate-binding protein